MTGEPHPSPTLSLRPEPGRDVNRREVTVSEFDNLKALFEKGHLSRRDFLNGAAAIGAAAMIGPSLLDADDMIYSINLHLGETKSPAKGILKQITEMKKLSPTQIQFTLEGGNADLPYVLSDYHLIVVPNGFTDWAKPDGTGAYKLESF